MARDPHQEAAYRWQDGREEEEPEERQIAVDPFSLRQFSRFNIDGPLPIPSVSVDRHLPAPTPAPAPRQLGSAAVPCPAERRDAHLAVAHSATPGRRSSAGREMELADIDEFDAVLPLPERRPSAPQRWGSDVPLIADSRGNDGRRKASHGDGAPFSCCLYLPGLTRRGKPPPIAAAGRVSSPSGPKTFRRSAATESDPGTVRQSTMSLAVSLERFECASSLSSSSASDPALDGCEASSSYIDLPLELILGSDGDEIDLPVHAAFMF